MYLSEMIDAVESKTGKELFPCADEKKTESLQGNVANIPKATGSEPPDDTGEPDGDTGEPDGDTGESEQGE